MQDRVEFHVDGWRALAVGLGRIIVGAAAFGWYWLQPVVYHPSGGQRAQFWKIVAGLMAAGFGL